MRPPQMSSFASSPTSFHRRNLPNPSPRIQCQSPISMFTSTQTSSSSPNTFPHCYPIDGSATSILNSSASISVFHLLQTRFKTISRCLNSFTRTISQTRWKTLQLNSIFFR
ncbi:unnamed protein product [Trifolium pratense]|uniref:Uncharacterized protein n=1 Tax=Trifolium pratense TaxID=57577 RepID=A0ACB0KG77_TRIPR|nr:unnamed protein product [Trifolium pratense]